jgi:hypothetical protein
MLLSSPFSTAMELLAAQRPVEIGLAFQGWHSENTKEVRRARDA